MMTTESNKTIKDFWESAHTIENHLWLTGSNPNGIMLMYDAEVPVKKEVLDIGVGLGDFSKTMYDNGNKVYAVDISETALSKVKDYAETYVTNELPKVPPVDAAFCHLVFQHCNNDMMQFILNNIPLKDNGYLYFQFAFLYHDEDLSGQLEAIVKKELLQFRNLEKVLNMMKSAGLFPVEISQPVFFPSEELIGWYLVKAEKSKQDWHPAKIERFEKFEILFPQNNSTIEFRLKENTRIIKALDSPAVLTVEQLTFEEKDGNKSALQIESDTVQVLLAQAEQYIEEGEKLNSAKEILAYALELDPSSAEAKCDLGIIEYMNGNYAEALKFMEMALLIDPENESFLYNKLEISKLINK